MRTQRMQVERAGVFALVLGSNAFFACGPEALEPSEPLGHAPPKLDYSYTRHLVALDEDVTYLKTPAGSVVRRANGSTQSPLELEAEERAAHRLRFGAMSAVFAARLASAAEDENLTVAIHFGAGLPWASLGGELASSDHSRQRRAGAALRQAIAEQGQTLAEELASEGVSKLVQVSDSMPVLFGRAPRVTIERLSRNPKITLLTSADNEEPLLHAGAPGNGITDPQIDTGFNALGYYGEGQKIAHIETAEDGIYEPHESLAFVTPDPDTDQRVTYQVEPADCVVYDTTGASSCPDIARHCLAIGHPGHPLQCVAIHASECVSVAVGSGGGVAYGAAKARLYYPNRGGPALSEDLTSPTVDCSPVGLADAYSWLADPEREVKTVNESFGCIGYGDGAAEGITQDYYARYFDMAISKSAGNEPKRAACPFSLNSTCVGGINKQGKMSCFSSWTNENGPDFARTDREEPDVVALAGDGEDDCLLPSQVDQVSFMQIGTPDQWGDATGTSYAAPAVAGFTALLKEACGDKKDHLWIRAVLRNSAWRRNVKDYAYSTPVAPATEAYDWKDGAGALTAEDALAYCLDDGSGSPSNASGNDEGCLDCGEGAPFRNPCKTCGPTPPGERHPLSAVPLVPGDGRLYKLYWRSGETLPEGARVRTTLTWDSCPSSVSGVAPSEIATDIDIVLVNTTLSIPVYASQSVTDNVEGFDIHVPWEGKYELYWTSFEGATACGGTAFEPLAWAVSWGDF